MAALYVVRSLDWKTFVDSKGSAAPGFILREPRLTLATERSVFRSDCVLRRDDLLDARATRRSVVVQEASAGLGRSRARP